MCKIIWIVWLLILIGFRIAFIDFIKINKIKNYANYIITFFLHITYDLHLSKNHVNDFSINI